jgi:hypothetical protein
MILLTVCLLTAPGCSSSDPDDTIHDNFDPMSELYMPFHGTEKLVFLKNNTDTVRFIASGLQQLY